jgi:hypothetical protein
VVQRKENYSVDLGSRGKKGILSCSYREFEWWTKIKSIRHASTYSHMERILMIESGLKYRQKPTKNESGIEAAGACQYSLSNLLPLPPAHTVKDDPD